MIELLSRELKKVRLQLNAKKTKVLHSHMDDEGSNFTYTIIDDAFVQILHPDDYHRYLGRHINLSPQRIKIEFDHRVHQAWAAFHKHRKCILNRHIALKKRLKYFDMCVTPVLLFAMSVFPVTKRQLLALDSLQRKMVRRIVG